MKLQMKKTISVLTPIDLVAIVSFKYDPDIRTCLRNFTIDWHYTHEALPACTTNTQAQLFSCVSSHVF